MEPAVKTEIDVNYGKLVQEIKQFGSTFTLGSFLTGLVLSLVPSGSVVHTLHIMLLTGPAALDIGSDYRYATELTAAPNFRNPPFSVS